MVSGWLVGRFQGQGGKQSSERVKCRFVVLMGFGALDAC